MLRCSKFMDTEINTHPPEYLPYVYVFCDNA